MVRAQRGRYARVSHVKRVRIIELAAAGSSQRLIARELQLKRTTVEYVLRKWNLHHEVNDRVKIGRPVKYSDADVRLLGRLIERGEASTAVQVHQIATTQYDMQLSIRTIRNIMHRYGLRMRHATKRPRLTSEHKRNRLEFARAHQHWDGNDWKRVIFSDETVITSDQLDSRHLVWTRTHNQLHPQLIVPSVQGGGAKIMVWDAFQHLASTIWFYWKIESTLRNILRCYGTTCYLSFSIISKIESTSFSKIMHLFMLQMPLRIIWNAQISLS